MSTGPAAYDLIAIDLDGTLLCPEGRISSANRDAIARARAAGVRVTVCTGRGMVECKGFTAQIGQRDPVVVAGGAMVSCPESLSTVHRFPMDRDLVGELVECMLAHKHAALVLKDPDGTRPSSTPNERGHDYLVVSPRGWDGIDPVTRWWFKTLNVPVRVVPRLNDDEHPDCTLRVGVCGTRRATREVADDVRTSFAHRATLHHFHAVVPGSHPDRTDDHILILEAFDRHVNKWTAINWLAERGRIDPARIAAIGNDINDVAMLRSAGLGVAMGNSIPEALDAADRRTLSNDRDGVAHAIDKILLGEW
ncbi:MAG: HAD family phosphatase [Phycisphaeraceae bacterium]|nr:HAD family phosphatase [Phycisphaeraceae bacterium]